MALEDVDLCQEAAERRGLVAARSVVRRAASAGNLSLRIGQRAQTEQAYYGPKLFEIAAGRGFVGTAASVTPAKAATTATEKLVIWAINLGAAVLEDKVDSLARRIASGAEVLYSSQVKTDIPECCMYASYYSCPLYGHTFVQELLPSTPGQPYSKSR